MRKDQSGRAKNYFFCAGCAFCKIYTDEVYGYRGFLVVSELLCGDVVDELRVTTESPPGHQLAFAHAGW